LDGFAALATTEPQKGDRWVRDGAETCALRVTHSDRPLPRLSPRRSASKAPGAFLRCARFDDQRGGGPSARLAGGLRARCAPSPGFGSRSFRTLTESSPGAAGAGNRLRAARR
jgi:hypothetical protein